MSVMLHRSNDDPLLLCYKALSHQPCPTARYNPCPCRCPCRRSLGA